MLPKAIQNEMDDESDEDRELKEELKLLVENLEGNDELLYVSTLEMLRHLIRTATASMTAVPKPLKYLVAYYERLKACRQHMRDTRARRLCADVLSVLAMSVDTAQAKRECLQYCLEGSTDLAADWGHEYVRHLESEIVEEWSNPGAKSSMLLPLVDHVIGFDMQHHAEIQACDLLMEIDLLHVLDQHISPDTHPRIALYLTSCANYVDEIESTKMLRFVLKQYTKYDESVKALIIAMQLKDEPYIEKLFAMCKDPLILKQMAFIAARQQINVHFPNDFLEKEELDNILCNSNLNSYFQSFGRQLDIMQPKTPEEIYKSWLEPTSLRKSLLLAEHKDSARENLAASFVNAFVNAAFGRDKLLTDEASGNGVPGHKWIYRNREHAMFSATASLGLIHLWDVDGGLTPIDKYLYSHDVQIKGGALLALGIVNCRVRNECEPAFALLAEYAAPSQPAVLQTGAVFGLGLAYAGTNRADVLALLLPMLLAEKTAHELLAVVCISCGLIAVSSCNHQVTSAILQKLMDNKGTSLLSSTYMKFILLGLSLCYMGRRDAMETVTAALEIFKEPFRSFAQTIVQMCAYAGTADVLVVQEFLHICSERYEEQEKQMQKPSSKKHRHHHHNSNNNNDGKSKRKSRHTLDSES